MPAEFARLDLQPHRRGLAAIYPSRRIFRREISAAAAVLWLAARLQGFFALGFQLLRRAKAVIRAGAAYELLRKLRVQIFALGLAIGTVRAADVGPFVPVQSKPTQVFEQLILELLLGTLDVGVLDAQDECPVLVPREKPVE